MPEKHPRLQSRDAAWLEIRDEAGSLTLLMLFMPGDQAFICSTLKDPDFFTIASNANIPLECPGIPAKRPSVKAPSVQVSCSALEIPMVFVGANLVEVRDESGFLVLYILCAPGKLPELFDKEHPGFARFAAGLELPLCHGADSAS